MSEREAGRFRGRLFGGFNRKDVLAYITSVYEELDYAQAENEMLRQRCEELEALLSQQDTAGAYSAEMPADYPGAYMPEAEYMQTEYMPQPGEWAEEGQFGLDPNTLTSPENLPPMAPPAPEPRQVPGQAVHEAPRVKPNLANPYPERSRKVKVRPARES